MKKKAPSRNQSFLGIHFPCGKRGQMEMIGLVIIVILLTLGMLFMAQFALKKEPKKKIFVRKGLAYSTMGALMKTSVSCDVSPGEPLPTGTITIVGNLIDDCAEYSYEYKTYLRGKSFYSCGEGMHTCAFLNKTIGDLLNKTLGNWNKHYEFKSSLLRLEEAEVLIHIKDEDGQGCPGERDTSGLFPINTKAGLVENVLYLCD